MNQNYDSLLNFLSSNEKLKLVEGFYYSDDVESITYADIKSFDVSDSSSQFWVHLNKTSESTGNIDMQFGPVSDSLFHENIREIQRNEEFVKKEYSAKCDCHESFYRTSNTDITISYLQYLNHHNDSSYHILIHYDPIK